MKANTFVPGVGSGGLNDKYEIKILICYLLKSINVPFSREQLSYIFQDEQIVNYFVFCDALAELIASGHIISEKNGADEIYTLGEIGIETADKLGSSLPSSLRDNLVVASIKLIARVKNERENEADIVPYKNGFLVKCVIHDVEFDLLKFDMYAPDMLQAERIKQNFQDNPLKIYQGFVKLLID